MIQVQNMQQPAQGVTAELYSQVEDYLALGKTGQWKMKPTIPKKVLPEKSSRKAAVKPLHPAALLRIQMNGPSA